MCNHQRRTRGLRHKCVKLLRRKIKSTQQSITTHCNGLSTAHCAPVPTFRNPRGHVRRKRTHRDTGSSLPTRKLLKRSICSNHYEGDAHTTLLSKMTGSQTVTKKPCLTTVFADHVPSVYLCLSDEQRDDINPIERKHPQHCRGIVGHVQPCCLLRCRKPATEPFARPHKPPHRLWK